MQQGTKIMYSAPSKTTFNVSVNTGYCIIGSAVIGPQSNAIYNLAETAGSHSYLRKIDENEIEKWSKIYNINPAEPSLAVTPNENYLFFLDNFSFTIVQLDTSNGSLIKSYAYSGLTPNFYSCTMKFSSDSASLFLNFNTASTIGVWKLVVSTPNVNWIQMTGRESSSGTILITDSSIVLNYKNSGTSKFIFQRLTYSPVRNLISKNINEENFEFHNLAKKNGKINSNFLIIKFSLKYALAIK